MESQANRRHLASAINDETVQAKLCAVALATVTQGKDFDDTKLFLCPACGYIEPDQPPATCPVCATRPEEFVQV